MSGAPTPRQAEILAYLKEAEAVLSERPTKAQIARRFKISQPTVRAHMQGLELKGLLTAKPCAHPSGEHHSGNVWTCTECGERYTTDGPSEDA